MKSANESPGPPPGALLSERFAYAKAATAFRFLRQPSRPIAPRPVAKSGRAVGSGVGANTAMQPNGTDAVAGAGERDEKIALVERIDRDRMRTRGGRQADGLGEWYCPARGRR